MGGCKSRSASQLVVNDRSGLSPVGVGPGFHVAPPVLPSEPSQSSNSCVGVVRSGRSNYGCREADEAGEPVAVGAVSTSRSRSSQAEQVPLLSLPSSHRSLSDPESKTARSLSKDSCREVKNIKEFVDDEVDCAETADMALDDSCCNFRLKMFFLLLALACFSFCLGGMASLFYLAGRGEPEAGMLEAEIGSGGDPTCDARIEVLKQDFSTKMKIASDDFHTRVRDVSKELTAARSSFKDQVANISEESDSLKKQLKIIWRPSPTSLKAGVTPKRAYVMMAYDQPGLPSVHLYGCLAMARSVKLLSKYPLVVLTNSTHLPDGTEVKKAFNALGAEVLPLKKVPIPDQLNAQAQFEWWIVAWWKIQAWALTQFEKVIWLDSDALLVRSMDYLFDRDWMWAQRDDWDCKLNQADMCSGMMLLFPSFADYNGILDFAKSATADLTKGDQKVIHQYFSVYTRRPINLLSDIEAAFGQCIGTAHPLYIQADRRDVPGVWNIPSFVHKSGGWADKDSSSFNICFQHNVTRQIFKVAANLINICHFHPLGEIWRARFCEAVAAAGMRDPSATSYCTDDCYVRGLPRPEWTKIGVKCGPLNTGMAALQYDARLPGHPLTVKVPGLP